MLTKDGSGSRSVHGSVASGGIRSKKMDPWIGWTSQIQVQVYTNNNASWNITLMVSDYWRSFHTARQDHETRAPKSHRCVQRTLWRYRKRWCQKLYRQDCNPINVNITGYNKKENDKFMYISCTFYYCIHPHVGTTHCTLSSSLS